MKHSARKVLVSAALALSIPLASAAIAQITATEVAFPKGHTSTTVAGAIKGDQIRAYVVRASAGQTMRVDMKGAPIVYFNVMPPGSTGEAIFTGSSEGNLFSGTLSSSGPYKIRVYQMRASARRAESGNYNLSIAVTGGSSAAHSGGAHPSGLGGLAGMDSIKAIDAMTSRGFVNVDSLESGNTQYGIFYNRSTRVCAQLAMAAGKVVSADDIKTHPKCR